MQNMVEDNIFTLVYIKSTLLLIKDHVENWLCSFMPQNLQCFVSYVKRKYL